MPKASIIFDKEIFQQLQKGALDKEIPVAEYVRGLVALGLRVEAAAENSTPPSNKDEISNVKMLWKNNLSWLLEPLYLLRHLTRYLVDEFNAPKNAAYTNELINKAREKAESCVKEMID
jgi:hypothetical protein